MTAKGLRLRKLPVEAGNSRGLEAKESPVKAHDSWGLYSDGINNYSQQQQLAQSRQDGRLTLTTTMSPKLALLMLNAGNSNEPKIGWMDNGSQKWQWGQNWQIWGYRLKRRWAWKHGSTHFFKGKNKVSSKQSRNTT
jgi:hypothetical protein